MAKKTDETQADPDVLRDENQTLRLQNDLVLDALAEMQEKIAALEAGRSDTPAPTAADDEETKLDAELASLKEEFKDYAAIEVFERRALSGVDANLAIRLKGDPDIVADPHGVRCYWKLRWFNFAIEGRAQRASAEGYIKVNWDDLADSDSVTTGDRTKPYVCKGERGTEVLCKIPLKLYTYKKKRDSARNAGLLTSESKLRDHIANSVGSLASKEGGNADQAASFTHGQISMTITKGERETVAG